MRANLNPTFRKELNGKKIIVDLEGTFKLTPYELNQIRFWINKYNTFRDLPIVLPVSKRFCLDFTEWNIHVILCGFKKSLFS